MSLRRRPRLATRRLGRRELTTVLFVHGTGVRQAAYNRALQQVVEHMAAVRPDCVVRPCYWGDECGAVLHADGASIPVVDGGRAIEPGERDPSIARWSLLDDDPFAELRVLAAAAAAGH